MRRSGIHLRLLVAAFALICAATFSLGFLGITMTRNSLSKNFENRITFLARYLALNSEVGVLIDNKPGLKRLAHNLLGEEGVAKVKIYGRQGKLLATVSKEVPGPLAVVEAPVFLRRSRDISFLFSSGIPPQIPEESGQEIIGGVRIVYSTWSIQKLMETITTRFIWFSAGLAMLAGLVFYFISRSIVAEVTRLGEAARKVAGGDRKLRAAPGKIPETRELALAFNAMLDSLDESREALAKADREMMRQNFLAEMGKFSLMIAHEFKNPLSIIKSSVDVLKKDPPREAGEVMITYMEDEIRRLNRLIEDFLTFARPAQPRFRPVDLNDLLRELVSRIELKKAHAEIVFQVDIPSQPCMTRGDPDLLMRALGNVIDNACNANQDRGTVRISAEVEGNTWISTIEDEGEGIPPDHFEKIFEPFFTTRAKGTGLGLAFATQVINSHDGAISAENGEGKGARFRVLLPVEREEEE
jgi:signal transduction histidine kinase